MSRFGYTPLLPEERQELSERGSIGQLYKQLEPYYENWISFNPYDEFEALRGPEEPVYKWLGTDGVGQTFVYHKSPMEKWIPLEDVEVLGNSHRDMDVDLTIKLDYKDGLEWYFECIDVLRRVVKTATTWDEIRFLMDACDALDAFMPQHVDGWGVRKMWTKPYMRPVRSTIHHPSVYDRLFSEFMEAEARAVCKCTPLMRVATFPRSGRR
jgi:hypothetical protein